MSTSTTTPFWKKIHQTVVSAGSKTITEDIVAEILKLSQDELLEGLLAYKPFTKASYDEFSTNADVNVDMKEFILDLSQEINLDTTITYPLLCNYLMFEYYGKIKEFWQVTRRGTTANLKENLWSFYTSERMFLLKTWRHIFEHVDNDDYEFSEQYKEFLKAIDKGKLLDNLIEQFRLVMDEWSLRQFEDESPHMELFMCRNIREQTEIISVFTLAITHQPLSTPQLSKIVMLFIQNSFSTIPPLYDFQKYTDSEHLKELMFTEIGCFITILRGYWDELNAAFWVSPVVRNLDECLVGQNLNDGISLVITSWLVLKFKAELDRQAGEKAMVLFHRGPFVVLESLVSSVIFKDCTLGEVVLKGCHKLLDEITLMYDDRKSLYSEPGVIPTIVQFLRHPALVTSCLQKRNGVDAVMEIAMKTFPCDFFSLTSFANALLEHEKHYKSIIALLNHIPHFLTDFNYNAPKGEVSLLKEHRRPIPDFDLITFPPYTRIRSFRIFDKNLLQYRAPYSYFLYLEYLVNTLISNGMSERKLDDALVKKVVAGFDVVVASIKHCQDLDFKLIGMDRILSRLNQILMHIEGHLLNGGLVKVFFDVQTSLILYRGSTFFDTCPAILWKVFFPHLQTETITDVRQLLFNQYLFEETVFMLLFKEEQYYEDHSLVLRFIKIFYNILIKVFQYKSFQLSGVAFLLNFVFVQHQTWPYQNEHQKSEITLWCLKVFHFVLQKDVADLNPEENKIFALCQHAFLNNVLIIESFLQLFIKDKHYLMNTMERESNWIAGPRLIQLNLIRIQLALLLLIMNQRKTYGKCSLDQRLKYIVKPVASYFTNSYSAVIAELSCRFLEKLAHDKHSPLLALLELDHYQVQSLFLERLRDLLEEETVKIAIVDLINTCISSQNGMTAAFFNLKCFMYWDGTETEDCEDYAGDSVSDFMVDYLQNIKKSHEYFKNPLQLGILRLLHNLWLNSRENLISNIANLKDFWPVMADPFFSDYVQDVEVYTVILNIMNREMSSNLDKISPRLLNTVEKFFKDTERVKDWLHFILDKSMVSSPDNLELLNAWMEFLVKTKRAIADKLSPEVRFLLTDSCLEGLNVKSGFTNVQTMYIWAQLYLMLTQSGWVLEEEGQKTAVAKLMPFIGSLCSYYHLLPADVREVLLSVINCTIVDLQVYFRANTDQFLIFLYHVGNIIDAEHSLLQNIVHTKEHGTETSNWMKPWMIAIFIGNSILSLKIESDDIPLWFFFRNFLEKVMDSVTSMMAHRSTLAFAKLAVGFMIAYAESPLLVKDFLRVDLFTFYYKVKAPPITICVGDAVLSGVPTDLREWWLLLIALIKLHRVLLETLGDQIFSVCFAFITEHDQLFKEMISLTKSTVDLTALTLVCEALILICTVLRLKPDWYLENQPSYIAVMEGAQITMNACVLSITRYKKINFYKMVEGHLLIVNEVSNEILVSVLNKLCEIVFWASICLKETKPNMHALMYTQRLPDYVTLMVQNDFSVPRFEMPIPQQLTYGALLCLADYLCKTLIQSSPETLAAMPKLSSFSFASLSQKARAKSMAQILEHCVEAADQYIGFVVYVRNEDLVHEKLSTFLQYEVGDFSGALTSSTIPELHYDTIKNALEGLMSFLSCEITCTMKYLSEEALFTYKREVSSEIQFFYEFVRKRTGEQYNATSKTPSSLQLSQADTDVTKRFVMTKFNAGDITDIADNNFLLVISNFLMNICNLSN